MLAPFSIYTFVKIPSLLECPALDLGESYNTIRSTEDLSSVKISLIFSEPQIQHTPVKSTSISESTWGEAIISGEGSISQAYEQ